MAFHSELGPAEGIHAPHAWVFADATARTNVTVNVEDIGKFALQQSDNTVWMLLDTTPTWSEITGGGGGGESNTASNLGAGTGLFAQKVGADLQFKSLTTGTKIGLTPSANEVQITTTAAVVTSTVPAASNAAAGSAGTSADAARADHKHQVSVGTPVSVGTSNQAGSANTLARSDHVHAHGNQGGGALHADATTSVSGFLSGTDKTKLDAFSAAGEYIRRDGTVAFTGAQSHGNQDVTNLKTATFAGELDNGTQTGANYTIDWTQGQKQVVTLGANITFAFTDPPGAANLILRLVQDGSGNRSAVWPANVKWSKGQTPNLTVTAGAEDLVSFYFNGTDYYGAFLDDFS